MSSIEVVKTLGVSTNGQVPSATPEVYFDGTQTISANAYSVPIYVANKDLVGVHLTCSSTGSPNGSLSMQSTNDISAQEGNRIPDVNLINWATISFFDEALSTLVTTRPVVGAQSYLLTVQMLSGRWWRVLWTNTSGTAALIIRAQVKANGGR
jgi:hypothetical protein